MSSKIDLKQERIERLEKYLETLRYKHGWGVPMDVVDAIRDRIELIRKGDKHPSESDGTF